jgi:hypothetical protein
LNLSLVLEKVKLFQFFGCVPPGAAMWQEELAA